MNNSIVVIPVLDAQLILSILLGFSNPDNILLNRPQVDLRSQLIPTVSAGKTLQLQHPTIYSPANFTRENIRRHEECHLQRLEGRVLA
jgi:hypothetical protein